MVPLGLVFVALIIVATIISAMNSVQDPAPLPLGFTLALKQKHRGKPVWRSLQSTDDQCKSTLNFCDRSPPGGNSVSDYNCCQKSKWDKEAVKVRVVGNCQSTRRVQETKVMKFQEQFWSAGGLSKLYKLDHQISQSDQFDWQSHCGTANCACVFHFVLQIFERYRIICTIYVISLNEQLLQLCPTVHDVKHSLHFQTPCLGQLDKMLTELKRVACDVRWSWMMECTNMAGKWVIQNVTSSLALVSTFWPFPGPGDTGDNQDKQIFRINLARLKLILG